MTSTSALGKWQRVVQLVVACVVVYYLITLIKPSLVGIIVDIEFPIIHDTAIMLAITSEIVERGLAPYREVFDMNLPGSYLCYGLLGLAFGFDNDVGMRIGEALLYLLICFFSVAALRPYGWLSMCAFPLLWLTMFFDLGYNVALQRETFALAPIAASLYLLSTHQSRSAVKTALWQGCVGGLAAWIKIPLILMCFPSYLVFLISRLREERKCIPSLLSYGAGLGLISLPFLAFLAWKGSLSEFFFLVTQYLPLYRDLNGDLHPSTAGAWLVFLKTAAWSPLGRQETYIVAGLLLIGAALSFAVKKELRPLIVAAAANVVMGVFCATLQNKGWEYHWLPFFYAATFGSALMLSHRLPVFIALIFVPLTLWVHDQTAHPKNLLVHTEAAKRILREGPVIQHSPHLAELEEDLRRLMQPGDAIQPFDVVYGVNTVRMRLGAPLGSRFIYDFHFFHHIESEPINRLRALLIEDLEKNKPRFLVDAKFPIAPNLSDEEGLSHSFEPLRNLIERRYKRIVSKDRYDIYEYSPQDIGTILVPS